MTNPNVWADIIGPVTTATVTAELLGITETELLERESEILRIHVLPDAWVFPVSQFKLTSHGVVVLDGVAQVIQILNGFTDDGLAMARWFGTPNRLLGSTIPWRALHVNKEGVVRAAKAHLDAMGGR